MNVPQLRALEGLLVGSSLVEAAKAAGVDRTTLHRWLRQDARFQAELHRVRRALFEAAEVRLANLAEAALDVVERAIQAGDRSIALNVLRGAGLLTGSRPTFGPEEASDVEREVQIEAYERGVRFEPVALQNQLDNLLRSTVGGPGAR